MLKTIFAFLKIIGFFLNLWKERDQAKAREKGKLAKEMVNAFQETDKKRQASRLNAVVGGINRL